MREVVLETRATGDLVGYLRDDPSGVAAVIDAVDGLAADPYPQASVAFGIDERRLRVARYRVYYRVAPAVVSVLRVGRAAP